CRRDRRFVNGPLVPMLDAHAYLPFVHECAPRPGSSQAPWGTGASSVGWGWLVGWLVGGVLGELVKPLVSGHRTGGSLGALHAILANLAHQRQGRAMCSFGVDRSAS